MKLGERYANALAQLLPSGIAWRGGCDESLLMRLLRAKSEELARYHVWLEQELKASIERFTDVQQGWSAPDYERLLTDKFGVASPLVRDNDHWQFPRLAADPRQKYIFRIRAKSAISPATQQYLNAYQQSHTDHHISRDLQSSVVVAAAVAHHATSKRTLQTAVVPLRDTRTLLQVAAAVANHNTWTMRIRAA